MGELFEVLWAVLPPFLLMFVGGIASKIECLPVGTESTLSRLIVRVLYPCFILHQVLGSTNPVPAKEAWLTPVFGFFAICLGFAIAHRIGRLMALKNTELRPFRFCSGIFNYGFFALPIASIVFGDFLVVKIILFNLGVEIAIWSIGVLVLTSSKLSLVRLLNPPAVSVLLALILQFFGGRALIPEPIWNTLSMISACSIPFALMVIGASFADLLKGFRPSAGYRVEAGAFLSRNVLIPACFVLYAVVGWFPENMEWMSKVLIVQAAMPAGVFALLVVRSYSECSETSIRTIMATMVGCLVTLPGWIYLGERVLPE